MADGNYCRYDEDAAREAVKSILPEGGDTEETPLSFYEEFQRGNEVDENCDSSTAVDDLHITQESKNDFELPNLSVDDPRHEKEKRSTINDDVHQGGQRISQTAGEFLTSSVPKDPSHDGTVCDVVAAHYNSVPEAGLDERNRSRILHLRNFNNWIKSMLIDEYLTKMRDSRPLGSTLKVLDMGCGKGGDLFKWRQGKITHLVCADIAATSIDQCKERYEDLKQRALRERHMQPIFSAEFIVANCTKERLREQYEDVTVKLDLVSCQFAFHYCFESLPQAECMMRNAAECLRTGGYFFGSCPNANAIISRVRKAGGKKFGNDVYSVEFDTPIDNEIPPPFFGTKYNFHMEGVVDCPEFLVHFPTLIRLALKFGLKLVVCEPFQSFFYRMKEKGRGLLGKMQSLETYPPFPDQELMGPLSEYQHADAFINSTGTQRKLGTLSRSEWEATTLYLIFVFEKVSS